MPVLAARLGGGGGHGGVPAATAAAGRLWKLARGDDETVVVATGPPQSISDEDGYRGITTWGGLQVEARRQATGLLSRMDEHAYRYAQWPATLRVSLRLVPPGAAGDMGGLGDGDGGGDAGAGEPAGGPASSASASSGYYGSRVTKSAPMPPQLRACGLPLLPPALALALAPAGGGAGSPGAGGVGAVASGAMQGAVCVTLPPVPAFAFPPESAVPVDPHRVDAMMPTVCRLLAGLVAEHGGVVGGASSGGSGGWCSTTALGRCVTLVSVGATGFGPTVAPAPVPLAAVASVAPTGSGVGSPSAPATPALLSVAAAAVGSAPVTAI